jgi:beta-ureidopropionase / N-carbamoyl-L-amino-acid hydrolase
MVGSKPAAQRASDLVSEARLWQRHLDMAKIGATPKGGVNRQALSREDTEARALLIHWSTERGYQCTIDGIGNMFVCRPGADPAAAPVATGSHLDSQPSGGRFDGVYGVLAGLEALQAIDEAGITTRRSLEVANWTNEEGSRFEQGCMGSQVWADPRKLDGMLRLEDACGITVADALRQMELALPPLGRRPFAFPMHAFIEAHIEQGPVLEMAAKTVGIVTGIQGSRRFSIEVHGEEAHAGTTPCAARKDALLAAVDIVSVLRRIFHDPKDIVRFTIGRFEVTPNALAVIPGHVSFSVDLRHPEEEVLARLGDQVEPVCRDRVGPCAVTVTETRRAPSRNFEGLVPDAIRRAAEALKIPHMPIYSGAGHDARYILDHCAAGMIFVPCEKGISHRENEYASSSDLAAGARVLAHVLVELSA